jgi:transposase
MAHAALHHVGPSERGRPTRLVASRGRQHQRPRRFWGDKTGPNPTDRSKPGSKHHVLTDGRGSPMAAILTGANTNDVTQLIPLVEAIPPIAGKPGRPRRRPDSLYADRGYDSEPHRNQLRHRGIRPIIAKRRTAHGTGLGRFRWVVERTNAWYHQFRRLRTRYDRRPDIHEAFLALASVIICWRVFSHGFC